MAGVKGRSGGARPGSGPKKRAKPIAEYGDGDPLKFLLSVMTDKSQDASLRVRAAIAAAQYTHTKLHDGGKKEAIERAAQEVAAGKFAPAQAPKLVVNNS